MRTSVINQTGDLPNMPTKGTNESQDLQPYLSSVFAPNDGEGHSDDDDSQESLELEISALRADILHHLETLKLPSWAGQGDARSQSKDNIRAMHALQREQTRMRELLVLRPKLDLL